MEKESEKLSKFKAHKITIDRDITIELEHGVTVIFSTMNAVRNMLEGYTIGLYIEVLVEGITIIKSGLNSDLETSNARAAYNKWTVDYFAKKKADGINAYSKFQDLYKRVTKID